MLMKWSKNHRIKKRWHFQEIQKRGNKIRSSCLLVLYKSNMVAQSRIGITVSKKVGNAVLRNRVKRWIREGARKEYHLLSNPLDLVVIAHPSIIEKGAVLVQKELRNVFCRLQKV